MEISLFNFCLFRLADLGYISYDLARLIYLIAEKQKGVNKQDLFELSGLDKDIFNNLLKELESKNLVKVYGNRYFLNKEDFLLCIFESNALLNKEVLINF